MEFEIRRRRGLWTKAAVDFVAILFSGGGPVGEYSDYEVVVSEAGRRIKIPCARRSECDEIVAYLSQDPGLELGDVGPALKRFRSAS